MAIAAMIFAGTTTSTAAVASYSNSALTTATTVALIQDEDAAPAEEESKGWHQELKERFVEGGPTFMGIVLLCLILGLAIAIERIIYLNLATTNTQKLAQDVEDAPY